MTDEVVPESNEPSESARPRRRRAASRPAGAPAKVEVSVAEAQTSAAQVESDAAQPAAAVSEEAPKRPARRRATRKTAPAAADEAVVVTGDAPKQAETLAQESASAEEPAAEENKPTRRRSSSKRAEETAADVPTEEAPAEEKPSRSRRSRSSKSEAPAEDTLTSSTEATQDEVAGESDEEDDVSAKLAEAEKLAQTRREVVANPFMSSEDRDKQLAELAGAIAGGDDDEDDQSDDEDAADKAQQSDSSDENDENDESESQDNDSSDDNQSEDKPSRRRRRRGGRRRRRGNNNRDNDDNDDDSDDNSDDDSDDNAEKSSDQSDDGSDDEKSKDDEDNGDNGEHATSRRRRRRRRRGGGGSSDSGDDEVTGIEGSTRMEAKRQRRKESRAAGRRRAPILSEAEFLARRESVNRKLVVRQGEEYTQLAVLEDDILVEHYVDRPSASSLIGNIYLGKIQNVLPSMEAAFIDIGRGRNAVLYAGEVDWESFGVTGEDRKVENVLKSGQTIVVQVTKDPVGQKGARLTHHISLPGRYIVYSPGGHLSGISRKLPDTERSRLRNVLNNHISDEESVIVRTAAEGVGEEDLVRDISRLKAQWEVIEKRSKQGGAPHALYTEPDLTLRIIRDLFTEDFEQIQVQGDGGPEDAYDAISAYVGHVAPNLLDRVRRYEPGEDGKDVFAVHRIDEQIAKALDRKVFLPSGGSLVIDRTEAMTVIDVNTGRFTGSGGNLEATVTSNNLEAAEEIVRQLRLRDLGGIIVVDFIDMVLPSNRELLLRRLIECLGRDRTRHQVAEVTSLGLVQMTRKRIGTGLAEAFTEECEHCHGQGYIKFEEPTDSQAPADGGDRPQRRRRKR
ncbi:Rne/Rng family ribonuclease [uncultured Tessaracoccus sp.]|uniref:Rne/Rng family ribonuclease n=1 Tax=uncultured Tessaracoccus sp. TaxID=905023 RepID=UPI00260B9ED7|nr:Rne/Rng family ribonuclease [uncultured Tessaracoccus sp.]